MKINLVLMTVFAVFMSSSPTAISAECATIQDGVLQTSAGDVIFTGYDEWGYNYQARIFNGGYCDSYRDAAWCQPYADVELLMKWNNAWLSNTDCNGDGLLDRHLGQNSYIDSGAWLTNHQAGKVDVNGKMRKWTYFVKIVAANSGDYKDGGYWYTPEGVEIGPVIWGDFAVVEEVLNDPSVGAHGILYLSPNGPGLGNLEGNP